MLELISHAIAATQATGPTGVANPAGGTGVANPAGGTGAQAVQKILPNLNDFVVTEGNLGLFIQAIVNWILVIAGALAVIYLVYGGILYITAGGDAEKATKGRTAVINAIIGVVIILLAYIIVRWVGNLVKIGESS